jgi:hypothetical protein
MKQEYLYIVSPTNGFISQLNMAGPIRHPLKIAKHMVRGMLMSGVPLFAYDLETKKTVQLTLQNVNDENLFNKETPESRANAVEEPVTVTEDKGVNIKNDDLPLNDDGTVNENAIQWSRYSSKQKRKLKAQIERINSEAVKNAADIAEELKEKERAEKENTDNTTEEEVSEPVVEVEPAPESTEELPVE